jgi:hypothetical protein
MEMEFCMPDKYQQRQDLTFEIFGKELSTVKTAIELIGVKRKLEIFKDRLKLIETRCDLATVKEVLDSAAGVEGSCYSHDRAAQEIAKSLSHTLKDVHETWNLLNSEHKLLQELMDQVRKAAAVALKALSNSDYRGVMSD